MDSKKAFYDNLHKKDLTLKLFLIISKQICLGHQLLAIAQGYETYKLKFGHHGSNHPIQNLSTKKVEITAQNHNYSVPESIQEIATITHRNLFDGTIEGLLYKNAPICSFQHHPEAGPGPLESSALFEEFLKLL